MGVGVGVGNMSCEAVDRVCYEGVDRVCSCGVL